MSTPKVEWSPMTNQGGTAIPMETQTLLGDESSNVDIRPAAWSSASSTPRIQQHRRSTTAPGAQFGIYWKTAATMLLTFLLGLASALGLHGYYSSLNGKEVGNNNQQQNALRVGTTLAFITQVSLAGSIHVAYVQTLWRALKRRELSLRAIDAGFAATGSLLSFANLEMVAKLRLSSFLALVAWCSPIPSLITPATLNVNSVSRYDATMMNVSSLDIAQAGVYAQFAFDVSGNAMATSTTGEVLPLPAPGTNATYVQSFFGPHVQCENANQSIISHIDAANNRRAAALRSSIKELANAYFAFVPALSNPNDTSANAPIQVANLSDVNGALYASNQLWLKFPPNNASETDFSIIPDPHPVYLLCEMHNASYQVNFTWLNGIQTLDLLNLDLHDATPYPAQPSYSATDEVDIAYSAVMWALSDQLTGTMGFYQDVSTNDTNDQIIANRTYSEIASSIDQTSLLGTSNFDSYFIRNHYLTKQNSTQPFSPQRLQDMALARNRTLDVLIPELSSNLTLSLISSPLLSPGQPANVTTSTPTNIYAYQPQNLFIAYGIAVLVALLANLIGLHAFFTNGVSYDISFSSIVCTTRDIHFSGLNAHERIGALPLDKKVGRTKMKFVVGGMEEMGKGGGRWGFGKA